MAKTKHIGELTRENYQTKLSHHQGFSGMTTANALANRFCDAVNAGLTPEREDLERAAYALEVLRWGNASKEKLARFAHRLGAVKKQGKKASQGKMWWVYVMSVVDVLVRTRELEADGHSKGEAERLARREVAKQVHIEDAAMRARMREYREKAETIINSLGL